MIFAARVDASWVDFSCSVYHNRNMGQIFMKDPTPPPGFFYWPSGYQGRAASVVVSGASFKRPWGYIHDPKAKVSPGEAPPIIHAPSRLMDYEVEFSAVIGRPLPLGKGLSAVDADEHIFGFVLLNDWSGEFVGALTIRAVHLLTLSRSSRCSSYRNEAPWAFE